VESISITGEESVEVVIGFSVEKLSGLSLTVDDVTGAVTSHLSTTFVGNSVIRDTQINIFIPGDTASLDILKELIVYNRVGQGFKLKSLVTFSLQSPKPIQYFRVNGVDAVRLSIYPKNAQNQVIASSELRHLVDQCFKGLRGQYRINLEFDSADFLKNELEKNVLRAGLSILIFTLLIIATYRDFKQVLLLLCTLLANTSIVIVLTAITGIKIHIYTIAGVSVSFGLMLDTAIVMMDYHRIFGNTKIAASLGAFTLITLSAILLFLLLPGIDIDAYWDFSLVISFSLITALCTSILFIPQVGALMYARKKPIYSITFRNLRRTNTLIKAYEKIIQILATRRKSFACLMLFIFGLPLFLLPKKLDTVPIYNETFGSTFYSENIAPHLEKYLGGTLGLFKRNLRSTIRTEKFERTKLVVEADVSSGTSIEQLNDAIKDLEKFLATIKGLDTYISIVSPNHAIVEITFSDSNGFLPRRLRSMLITRAIDLAGIGWRVHGVGDAFINAIEEDVYGFEILVKGYNFEKLQKVASDVAIDLAQHSRIQKVSIDENLNRWDEGAEEFIFKTNAFEMKARTTNLQEISYAIDIATNQGFRIGSIRVDRLRSPLVMKEENAAAFDKWKLQNRPLRIGPGRLGALGKFSSIEKREKPGVIYKVDRQYLRVIGFDYYGLPEYAIRYMEEIIARQNAKMPLGYSAEKKTDLPRDHAHGNTDLGVLLLAFVIQFIICSVLFESFRVPLLILITTPISFIGIFFAGAFFDVSIDQGIFAAFLLVGALTVNSALLMMIDFKSNVVKAHNRNRRWIRTIINRGRTIFLTLLSTGCSMVPYVFLSDGDFFWHTFSVLTIGGILMCFVSLFIWLPVLNYKPG
jgi:multidrug efflux pump subunit AcrB